MNVHWQEQRGMTTGRLIIMVGPLLALTALTALFAAAASFLDWHRAQMLPIAAVACTLQLALSATVLYRGMTERRYADRQIKRAEARVGDIVESAMDAIITVGTDQRIAVFNRAAEQMFGRSRETVLGQPISVLIPERFRVKPGVHIEHYARTGSTSRRMGDQTVLWALRADGTEFPIEASISQHREDNRQLLTVILRDVSSRLRADEALRESREELRELAAASHNVREQEKSRIARELHDELAQALTALKIDVSWVREHLPDADPQVAGKLAAMQGLLDNTVAATRRISAELRPLMLDDLGLIPAVEWLVQNFSQRTGIACELAVGHSDFDLQDPHATAVFRILQESLTNVARHSRATQVEINLERHPSGISLSVSDNGEGFDATGPRKPGSFGILGLRERAHLLGGEVRVDSERGHGTRIEVTIPILPGMESDGVSPSSGRSET